MKTEWVYIGASTQNIMFHSKCVIQETSAFTTGHWLAVPLSPRRREELQGGGGETKIRNRYFHELLIETIEDMTQNHFTLRLWHLWLLVIQLSPPSCEVSGGWWMSMCLCISLWLDDVVTDASCLHNVTIDNGGTTPRGPSIILQSWRHLSE